MTSPLRLGSRDVGTAAPFAIAFCGLDRAVEAAAKSMLHLLLPMLGHRWRIGSETNSDVVVVEQGALAGLRQGGHARPEALYVAIADGAVPVGAFCTVQRPINGTRLIEVLHKAEAEIERRRAHLDATTVLPTRLRAEMTEGERSIETTMRVAVRWILQKSTGAVTMFSATAGKLLSAVPKRGYATRLSSAQIADLLRATPPSNC
jgi:hypothetical protein